MRRFLCLLLAILFYCLLAPARDRVLTDRVTDDAGIPIPFASVKVKRTNPAVHNWIGSTFRTNGSSLSYSYPQALLNMAALINRSTDVLLKNARNSGINLSLDIT
jgi:hypothetical protein